MDRVDSVPPVPLAELRVPLCVLRVSVVKPKTCVRPPIVADGEDAVPPCVFPGTDRGLNSDLVLAIPACSSGKRISPVQPGAMCVSVVNQGKTFVSSAVAH